MEALWNFNEEMEKRTALAQEAVTRYLPTGEEAGLLKEAMSYACLAGGKRIRPVLLYEGYRLMGGEGGEVLPFMAAIEYIHTHSLIHDDLPALDNDDMRRGRPTTHKRYGEALGILAGDALLNLAYETMALSFAMEGDVGCKARAMQILAVKTGHGGMLGGQSVDVLNEGKPLDGKTLSYIYEKKTSALIEGSLMAGAALAGAGERELALLEKAGRLTGLAFQILDDCLDLESTVEELGKPIHSDEKNQKTTYVTLHGLQESKEMVRAYSEEAVMAVRELGGDHVFLEELIGWLSSRKK